MDTINLGDVEITRVVEWQGPIAPMPALFPDLERHGWRADGGRLTPHFWHPGTDEYLAAVQTWVLRSEGKIVLVDTGVGNNKERSYMPAWRHRDGDFLDRLAAAGVRPEDVDLVINTHIHSDHVGWNTRLADRAWVPTFPNATYLIARPDFDYWNPRNDIPKRGSVNGINARLANGSTFEDSVDPVHEAGQTVLWEGTSHRIDRNLTLELAPGHTPGSTVVRLESGTDRAFFVGDVVHTPLQFTHPDCDTCLSEDQAEAARSRIRVLGEAAEHHALVFPAHFPGAGAAEIRRTGSAFEVRRWAPFTPPEVHS
ncbi:MULTISPECIES: MBL fold metallo-hydrolase [Amycolatopsis]|uniref:Glyoxylase, beta-lactamase superfamily II n=2 Tax=Amycolatopsis TaxID=1813 RepID=A0A1I3WNU6_9PSEU|nr:MBL fold metallo-hydrolase [Amycolatopsis sacchari]SFK08136.1 Glyoxylase, beta-lactamase superfamily II [Amycolatopsis sacchari]